MKQLVDDFLENFDSGNNEKAMELLEKILEEN